jgi:hypothetical protein
MHEDDESDPVNHSVVRRELIAPGELHKTGTLTKDNSTSTMLPKPTQLGAHNNAAGNTGATITAPRLGNTGGAIPSTVAPSMTVPLVSTMSCLH